MDMDGAGGWRRGERASAAVFSMLMVAAVLSPLWQYRRKLAERVDGFPLSWYPMFSAKRRRHCWITYPVGVRADGERRYLPCGALGPGGINQVRRQLYRIAVRGNQPGTYARRLAQRVARRPDCADLLSVEVLRTRFDLDSCLLEQVVRGHERVLAAAPVPGHISRAGGSAT